MLALLALIHFQIPTAPTLAQQLHAFSLQSNVGLLYLMEDGKDPTWLPAHCALNGWYTPKHALAQLLAGTGITYQFTTERSVTLKDRLKTSRLKTSRSTPIVEPCTCAGIPGAPWCWAQREQVIGYLETCR